MSKFLIIAGFHRSGTSMLTQLLQNVGYRLPSNLVGPNITNPDGHFEDYRVINFHDELLAKAKTSWQFTKEYSRLPFDERRFWELYESLTVNLEKNDTLLIKDPRICLFLGGWEEALGEDVRYVGVTRHWLYSVESLLSRHSLRIAEAIHSKNLGRHFNFWIEPTLAARMWLAYNKALITFRRQQRNKMALFTQRGLADSERIAVDLSRIGVECDDALFVSHDETKTHGSVSARINSLLPVDLRMELDALWNELLAESDCASEDEHVTFYFPDTKNVASQDKGARRGQIQWTSSDAHEGALIQVSKVNDVHSQLVDIENIMRGKTQDAGRFLQKVELLVQLNRSPEAISILERLIESAPDYSKARVRLFELVEMTEGASSAIDLYQLGVAKGARPIKQLEGRIQMRTNFRKAKLNYFRELKESSTLGDKIDYISQLSAEVSDEHARLDLVERLWRIWS